jgi:hypothetical protein
MQELDVINTSLIVKNPAGWNASAATGDGMTTASTANCDAMWSRGTRWDAYPSDAIIKDVSHLSIQV